MAIRWRQGLGLAPTAAGAMQFPKTRVDLDFLRVTCVDETNGFLGSELGMDEIELGGQAIDTSKASSPNHGIAPIKAFRLPWKFNDGTTHDFNSWKQFHSFVLKGLNKYPATYVVTLIMAEIDSGSFQSSLNKILNGVKDETIAYITAAIGGQIGLGGGPAGVILGLAVGYAVGRVISYITGLFDDVIFHPVTVPLTVASAGANLTTSSRDIRFKGPGEHIVRCQWAFNR